MKQHVLSYLSTIKSEILEINKSLYKFNEPTFNEFESYNYIISLLKDHGFCIENNFNNITSAFRGTIGYGYPEICFICKYSTGSTDGHIFGNNSNATIAIGSAIGLSSIINKLSGTIHIIGCPGKYSNGSEIILTKENVFETSSVIFAPHVDNSTVLNNFSPACTTLEISYSNNKENPDVNISCLDFCLHTIHFINQLIQNTSSDCYMDHLKLYCDNSENDYPTSAKAKFEIKCKSSVICSDIENHIRTYINCLKNIMNISCSINLVELPCNELIDNYVINKVFENNLKECGLINVNHNKNVLYPLSIGNVSHTTPTIYPSINIVDDCNISCPSIEFKNCTITPFAEKNIWKAIEALSLTAIDLLERPDLIEESTKSLLKDIK